jgi:hypothetical protein
MFYLRLKPPFDERNELTRNVLIEKRKGECVCSLRMCFRLSVIGMNFK